MRITGETTINAAVGMATELGAGQLNVIGWDDSDKPVFGVFVIVNPELVRLINDTVEKWDRERR